MPIPTMTIPMVNINTAGITKAVSTAVAPRRLRNPEALRTRISPLLSHRLWQPRAATPPVDLSCDQPGPAGLDQLGLGLWGSLRIVTWRDRVTVLEPRKFVISLNG